MDSLTFLKNKKYQIHIGAPMRLTYEHATKTVLVLNSQSVLHFLTFDTKSDGFSIRNSTPPLEELEGQNITFMEFLVDSAEALIFTENGAIMTVNQDGMVDIKAQNDDGITGGSLSPAQEYIYVVTNNNTLIQLDMEFDLVKEVPLDDHATEKSEGYQPQFSWKADGSFFAINIQTNIGRKCHTRDEMLGIFRSPSLSDPDPEGLVQSVSEKSRANMSKLVAWQPSAGIIAGSDFINVNGKKVNRVIFWEKNSLRHLQFSLPDQVTDILNLTWSQDSQILLAQVLLKNSTRWLYFYYRSNYHWYLKKTVQITQQTQYLLFKHKNNSLVLSDKNMLQILEFEIKLNSTTWKNYAEESINSNMLYCSVDGEIMKITNFGNGLMPPPMCHREIRVKGNLQGVDVFGDYILAISEDAVQVYHWGTNSLQEYEDQSKEKNGFKILTGLKIFQINNDEVKFEANGQSYSLKEGKIERIQEKPQPKTYSFLKNQSEKICIDEEISLVDGDLTINGNRIMENCSSFALYHQFLIFTRSTSDMYDKLYVLDLELDSWIIEDFSQEKMRHKIDQIESKKMLNYRSIERGSKIVCCAKNRVVFTLPRGNLEGIFPKVIMIKHVKKCMESSKFKEAFETIRTNKLDLNLLYDLNPKTFTENSETILTGFGKPDYLNLFVSQLKDEISSELNYCLPVDEIDENLSYINVKLNGKKVREVCEIISSTLRKCNSDRYILSIFTSEIKMGKLNDVLFEIKEMKQNDTEEEIPPHLQEEGVKNVKKPLSSQQILEYVCWLVDANAIYEASLLTYDLELAAMTARCTQMDPKEYIPYLESLKEIKEPLELRRKICLDLKKYQTAVMELSKGSQQQKQFTLELIAKHKIYKCGLKAYSADLTYLRRVKNIIINELINNGETNEAYRIALSLPDYEKALEIAIKSAEGKKIKETIENLPNLTPSQKKQKALNIMKDIGSEGFKDKTQYAKLLTYTDQYDEAFRCYLSSGNYQKAFKYYNKITEQLRYGDYPKEQMSLIFSLQKNLLLKDKNQLLQKADRLVKVHKFKSLQGNTFTARNRENDDMYSEVSVSSKTGSSYTISTTTGMKRKKDKKRSILSRNVKEGSLLEEEYLVAFLHDIKSRVEQNIRQTKLLIQHLIYFNLIEEAETLRDLGNQYYVECKRCCPKYYGQVRFEADHPQFNELLQVYENPLGEERDKEKAKKPAIESFNYLF